MLCILRTYLDLQNLVQLVFVVLLVIVHVVLVSLLVFLPLLLEFVLWLWQMAFTLQIDLDKLLKLLPPAPE